MPFFPETNAFYGKKDRGFESRHGVRFLGINALECFFVTRFALLLLVFGNILEKKVAIVSYLCVYAETSLTRQRLVLRFQLIDLPLQLVPLGGAQPHPLLHVVHVLLLPPARILRRNLAANF
jgi:hypothetical protein